MKLILLAALQVAAYASVTFFRQRFGDAASYPFERTPAMLIMVWTFAAVSALTFGVIYRQRKSIARGGRSWAIPLVLATAMVLTVAIAQRPEGAADIYWNTVMSRAWIIHGENPYRTAPQNFPDDPVYPLTIEAWRGSTMVYGPLWMAFSGLPVLISKDPATEFLIMKALLAAAYIAAGLILHRLLGKDDKAYANLMLTFWLLSPHAIFEIVNAAHNEGLLLLALAVAAAGFVKKKPEWALPGLAAAALIKIWPIALVPFLLGLRGARPRQWAGGAAGGAALTAASLALFGWPKGMFDALGMLHGAGAGLPWQMAADAIFALIVLGLLMAVRLGRTTPAAAMAAATFAFFGVSMSWVYPWYLLAAVPWVAVMTRRSGLLALMLGTMAAASFAAYAADIWILQLLCPILAVISYFSPSLTQKKE